jgi:hypothetical protein
MRLVVIESPLRGRVPSWVPLQLAPQVERFHRWLNRHYAKQCMLDSLRRGEAPYASHVLFDQPGLLDDANPDQRTTGLRAGIYWGRVAEARAVYCDRGISDGMRAGIASAPHTQMIEFRWLYEARDPFTVARVKQLENMISFRNGNGAAGASDR